MTGASVTTSLRRRLQVKAARALLQWSQQQLADEAGVDYGVVSRFEKGEPMRQTSVDLLTQALTRAGIDFTDRGVELREDQW